jgi:hypothetical protein
MTVLPGDLTSYRSDAELKHRYQGMIMITVSEARKVYPAPSVPDGRVVIGKPVEVVYDLSGSGYSGPFELEFVLDNQDDVGPVSQKVPWVPGKPIKIEMRPFKGFEVGDKVRARAWLYYIVQDPQDPFLIRVETPYSQTYDVVA